jgi:hypothetical protein
MSVSGKLHDPNSGVRRVILTTAPELHPFSNSPGAAQNYFCHGFDMKGFQYQIDLQAMPAGVSIDQIQANQVWWVEKRTSLYRLYLYAGTYDPTTRQITSTASLPATANSNLNNLTVASGVSISGGLSVYNNPVAVTNIATQLNVYNNALITANLTVSGSITQTGVPVVNNVWSVGPSAVVTISGYNTYLIIMNGYGSRGTTGYLTYWFNQSYSPSMLAPATLITLNTYALTANADYSSSATAIFQPTGGYSTPWYAGTVNQTYSAGNATAVVVGLN